MADGDRALACIIGLFSVGFPCMKLGSAPRRRLWRQSLGSRIPGWFRTLSNWSMLDVVLVALVIFAAKTSGLAAAVAKPGLWFFAAIDGAHGEASVRWLKPGEQRR